MTLLAQDLTAVDEQRLVAFWRSLPVWRRIQIIAELHETADALALGDLRRRFPADTAEQRHARLRQRRRMLEQG